jgi:hypothetical protein
MMRRLRASRTVRAVRDAGVIVILAGLIWALVASLGGVEIPACRDPGRGSCGIGIAIIVAVALVVFAVASLATWAVVKSERAVADVLQPYRYGRWLSLREVERAGGSPGSFAVEVHYHDVAGGRVGGVELALEVMGRDARTVGDTRVNAITDHRGVATIPVRIVGGPAVLTVHAAVSGDPAVRAVDGVFVVGL